MEIDTVEYKNYKIKIHSDENPESPREWDNLGTMICFLSTYDLGDEKTDYFQKDVNIFEDWRKVNEDRLVILPLYLYDHSGITMSTTRFSCPWDSGQVGWIYAFTKDIVEEFGKKRMSEALKKKAENILQREVEAYDDFLTGNVYGYVIETDEEEHLDSCWGFYGDPEKSGLLEYAKSFIDEYVKQIDFLEETIYPVLY